MVTNRKPTGRASGIPAGLGAGLLISLAVLLAGSFVTAKLMDAGILPEKKVGYGVMGILILSSLAGAAVSTAKIRRRRLLVCLLSGGVFFLSLLLITALFFGAQYSGVGETALLVLCGSMLWAIGGSFRKERKRFPKIKV